VSHVLVTSGNRIIADKHYMTFDKAGHQATITIFRAGKAVAHCVCGYRREYAYPDSNSIHVFVDTCRHAVGEVQS